MTVNFHTPPGDQDAGREGRRWTYDRATGGLRPIERAGDPPYGNPPEPDEELAPVSELERVEAERDEARKRAAEGDDALDAVEAACVEARAERDDALSWFEDSQLEVKDEALSHGVTTDDWVDADGRARAAQSRYEALRGGVEGLAERSDELAGGTDGYRREIYEALALDLRALLDQKGEGGAHEGYQLTPEECREIFALCLAHGMRPPELHPSHPLVTGVDKLGLSQPHPEDGDPGRAVRLPTQPKDKPACETCGGSGETFAPDGGGWQTWGGALGEGGFQYVLKPCPDCTTGKQVEAARCERCLGGGQEFVEFGRSSCGRPTGLYPCEACNGTGKQAEVGVGAGDAADGPVGADDLPRVFGETASVDSNLNQGGGDEPCTTCGLYPDGTKADEPQGGDAAVPAEPSDDSGRHVAGAAVEDGGGPETSDDWPWPDELWIGGDIDRPWLTWGTVPNQNWTASRRYVPAPQPSHVEGEARDVIVDFLGSWSYCAVAQAKNPKTSCLEAAADQLLAALPSTQQIDIQGLEDEIEKRATDAEADAMLGNGLDLQTTARHEILREVGELVREHLSGSGGKR